MLHNRISARLVSKTKPNTITNKEGKGRYGSLQPAID